ncbi:hypothetical protein [Alysiella sp.]|uniref:hypothetical protein n=1 Tax=Alysiella sp. TaxID=1872483 RepID=UPI0026DAB024|nr:hypothetical protein [Alysiella sp.]
MTYVGWVHEPPFHTEQFGLFCFRLPEKGKYRCQLDWATVFLRSFCWKPSMNLGI